MIFLVLGWFALYHGALLWLALRFKGKSWRWWWFGAVMTVGLGIAWFDQLYIRFVVIDHYCQVNKDKLGFHEYQSAVLKADQVIWLRETEKSTYAGPITHPEIIDKTYESGTSRIEISNIFSCRRSDGNNERWACIAHGLTDFEISESVDFLGIHMATKRIRQMKQGGQVLREAVIYEWSGSNFFSVFKLNIPVLYQEESCGGDWYDVARGKTWELNPQE